MVDFLRQFNEPSTNDEMDLGIDDKNNILPCDKPKHRENSAASHIQELLQLWTRYTTILAKDDPAVRNIAAELCTLLVKTKSLDALVIFLEALPDTRDYRANEHIIRAKIHAALHKKETKTVYKLVEKNQFVDGEDLIKVWDEALYVDEEKRTKKALTPLSRFRARKRYPPPKSICPDGIRKTNTLPREATAFLKSWLMNHMTDPYPSSGENQQLAKISGLTPAQVKTWFANARRRSKSTEEFQKRCKPESDCSPVNSPQLTQLQMAANTATHPSYYLFGGGEQLSHMDSNQPGSCCEYYQSYSSGYNRHPHECQNDYLNDHHNYPAYNNMRLFRPSEQSYYDVSGRNQLDIATKGHHHFEYPAHLYY